MSDEPAGHVARAVKRETARAARRGGGPGPGLPKGRVLRRALAGDPDQQYYVYVPSRGGRGAPIFVAIHSGAGNAREQAALFARHCETRGAVLVAPHFAEHFGDYQRLGREGRGKRADLALHAILAEVEASTGASAGKIYLFGYRGGARFAHRYLMAHPERVARAVIAFADSYTLPDPGRPFPQGTGRSDDLPGLRFDPAAFLRIPIALFVAPDEVRGDGSGSKRGARSGPGGTPVEAARSWLSAMRAAAHERELDVRVSYREVPGPHSSFKAFMKQAGLGERVFESLFPPEPEPAEGMAPAASHAWLRRLGDPRLRRLAAPLALCAAALLALVPIGLCAQYRFSHVVSRNAVVKGHIAEVGAGLDGVVRSLRADAGDRVRAGQVLAQLEDRHLRARLERARSQLEKATRELEVERMAIENERLRLDTRVSEGSARMAAAGAGVRAARSRASEVERQLALERSLAERGFTANERVLAAETELRTAQALVAAARAEYDAVAAAQDSAQVDSDGIGVREQRIAVLESEIDALRAERAVAEAAVAGAVIRAPDDGAIVRRIVEPGASTVVGQPIISLWVGEKIWVEAWIDEDDLSRIEVGSPATVTLKTHPDREFSGVVERIGVSTDFELPDSEVPQPRHTRMRSSPLVGLRVRLEEQDQGLFPGLSAVVAIRKRGR